MGQLIEFKQLKALGTRLRSSGTKIVFTNGHFDLLHVGHLRYLQAARSLGDALVVGVNDDNMTRQRKGPGRPIVPEADRAELLSGLACVDYAVIFPQQTAEAIIRALQPDVYVKGGDYATNDQELTSGKLPLPEADVVRAYGGQIQTIPLIEGRSTTNLEQRIIERVCSSRH